MFPLPVAIFALYRRSTTQAKQSLLDDEGSATILREITKPTRTRQSGRELRFECQWT